MGQLDRKDHEQIASDIVGDFIQQVLKQPDIDTSQAVTQMVKEVSTEVRVKQLERKRG